MVKNQHSAELPNVVGQMSGRKKSMRKCIGEWKEQTNLVHVRRLDQMTERLAQSQQDQNSPGRLSGEVPADMRRSLILKGGVNYWAGYRVAQPARNGLQQGDVINNVEPVKRLMVSPAFLKLQGNSKSVCTMRVIRQGYPIFIPFKIVEITIRWKCKKSDHLVRFFIAC